MRTLAYTLGGVLLFALHAMRELGERVHIRSLTDFDQIENGYEVVLIEIEDARIRDAYEAVGATVLLIGDAQAKPTKETEEAPAADAASEPVATAPIDPAAEPAPHAKEEDDGTHTRGRKRKA